MVEELVINRFLFVILIFFYIFCTTISNPLFIFIVIAIFYCLQIDSKP